MIDKHHHERTLAARVTIRKALGLPGIGVLEEM